jgi:hypothetical protein
MKKFVVSVLFFLSLTGVCYAIPATPQSPIHMSTKVQVVTHKPVRNIIMSKINHGEELQEGDILF